MIPGIRKLLKGENSSKSIGICKNSPEGSKIKLPPPKIAEKALKNNNAIATFRVDFSIFQIYENPKNGYNSYNHLKKNE
jgi:hypothetical protein